MAQLAQQIAAQTEQMVTQPLCRLEGVEVDSRSLPLAWIEEGDQMDVLGTEDIRINRGRGRPISSRRQESRLHDSRQTESVSFCQVAGHCVADKDRMHQLVGMGAIGQQQFGSHRAFAHPRHRENHCAALMSGTDRQPVYLLLLQFHPTASQQHHQQQETHPRCPMPSEPGKESAEEPCGQQYQRPLNRQKQCIHPLSQPDTCHKGKHGNDKGMERKEATHRRCLI